MYKLGRGEVIVEKLKRLTEMTTSGGWAAKIGPEVLASVLSQLPKNENNNNLLVGLDTADDAAVYKLNDETALIQTLDFFTPMIDDPYIFGQIAAANSLSDVYAMGGKPIVAMNIVCFPSCHDMNILAEILKGGFDKVKESGALLVGGHTVDDKEPKYGLSISGIVHPEKVLSNATARVGDKLILTKPIGVGILNTAMKENLVSKEISDKVIEVMVHLNKYAAKSFDYIKVNSVTDITGFGLLGHALEMAKASNVSIEINSKDVPILDGAIDMANMGIIPAGMYRNKEYISRDVNIIDVDTAIEDILYDPQTSGGLLISVKEELADKLVEDMKLNGSIEAKIIGIGNIFLVKYPDLLAICSETPSISTAPPDKTIPFVKCPLKPDSSIVVVIKSIMSPVLAKIISFISLNVTFLAPYLIVLSASICLFFNLFNISSAPSWDCPRRASPTP